MIDPASGTKKNAKKRRRSNNQVGPAGGGVSTQSLGSGDRDGGGGVSWSTIGTSSSWNREGTDLESGPTAANVGTLFWAAPEILRAGSASASHASDAYALGVVLWELATRSDPYPEENPVAVAMEVVQGRRPDVENVQREMMPMVKLAQGLWGGEPEARLQFSQVASKLASLFNPNAVATPTLRTAPSGVMCLVRVAVSSALDDVLVDPEATSESLLAFHHSVRQCGTSAGSVVVDWGLEWVTLACYRPGQVLSVLEALQEEKENEVGLGGCRYPISVIAARGAISSSKDPVTRMSVLTGDVVGTMKEMTGVLGGSPGVLLAEDVYEPLQRDLAAGWTLEEGDGNKYVQISSLTHPNCFGGSDLSGVGGSSSSKGSEWVVDKCFIQGLLSGAKEGGTKLPDHMGSYAKVFAATCPTEGPVLIKLLLRQTFTVEELVRVARIAARAASASTGPLLGPIRVCFERPYVALVFRKLPHGSLADVTGSLSARERRLLLQSLASNVAILHATLRSGHGSLTPRNVLVKRSNGKLASTVLTDFALSGIKSNMGTMTVVPSVSYMSPEDMRGQAETLPGDVFALSSIVYEVMTGTVAFDGSNALEVGYRLCSGYRPDVLPSVIPSEPLRSLILGGWNEDVGARLDAADYARTMSGLSDEHFVSRRLRPTAR